MINRGDDGNLFGPYGGGSHFSVGCYGDDCNLFGPYGCGCHLSVGCYGDD